MKVSIVIVNYKVQEKLLSCLKSIYDSKPKTEFEIIVVNNGEDDLSASLKNAFPKVVYVKSPKNLGYGGGNNLGAGYAKGEYLFIINPDTLLFKNTIDELVEYLVKNKNVGIASPLLVDKNEKLFILQGTKELTPLRGIVCLSFIERIFPNNPVSRAYWLKDWKHTALKEVEVCPGTALMISRRLFTKVGGFDERFFLYFEEDDISRRVRKLGLKIFILAKAKIFHEVGASTKQINNSNQFFAKSRFLYFKKYYGILAALLVESFLKLNKTTFLLSVIFMSALLLRLYNLAHGMTFIGDQGWFYLSARDLLISGKIPLVGITSSHTWLHQGPLWTYMLALVLPLFKFNPLAGGYLTAFFGTLAAVLMYQIGSRLFSTKVGVLAALLYATSPLIIFFDRMPFDPGPIPFFTVLYLFALYKWVKGNVRYFPVLLLLLGILYNLELATFTLAFPFVLIFAYGVWEKKDWVTNLLSKKIIGLSLLLPTLVMLPVIVYDFSHGFKQTVVFVGWTLYKPFSSLLMHSAGSSHSSIGIVINFLSVSLSKLLFQPSEIVAAILFVLATAYLIYIAWKKRSVAKGLLLFLLLVSLAGIIANQTPSDAYLPIVFPFVIFTVAILFDYLLKLKVLKFVIVIFFAFMLLANAYSAFNNDLKPDLQNRINAIDKVIKIANGRSYNLVGRGAGSQFESFTMNYQYLLWWKGYAESTQNEKLKIVIWETVNGITVYQK